MAIRYTIKAFTQDGGEYWIHNPEEEVLITGDPWFEVGDNINGWAEFDIYPNHPNYQYVKKLTTDITFYKDGVEKFTGRVLYDDEDMAGVKHVAVEGELGYFNDSVQRPAVYHDIPPRSLLQTYIDLHNAQVENRKKFVLGQVTVEDSNDSLYRYSNYETTRETLDDKLVSRLGGHLVIRKEDGNRILDYLSDATYYRNATQTIEFGKNLLDYAKNIDATDVITCLLPLGAQQEEEDIEGLVKYLDISSINGGTDYVTDDAAVAEYGRIIGVEHWDDVTLPENLKSKAEAELKNRQYENLVLELKAVDLNLTNEEIDDLWVGNQVRCISEPHGMDEWYPISKMRVYLMRPDQNTFTLGVEKQNATYIGSNRQSSADLTRMIEEVPTKGDILKQALEEARDLINSMVASGYAIHEPNEFIVADDPDYKNQAKYLWRWGAGGMAHYSDGYYGDIDGVAITMDGHINGKMLIANSVVAESIDFGYTELVESYADEVGRTVQETVTNSITNLENRIALSVVSTKESILQKNYVVNGETETLDLGSFTFSGSSYSLEMAERENVNCIKLTFVKACGVTIQQGLGTLPAGNYTVQCETEYDSDYDRPSYIRIGFSNAYNTVYYNNLDKDQFNCVKQSFEISSSNRTFYAYVYGYAGSVVYIKNLRCLQNFEELLDQVSAELTVEINRIAADVSETYYATQHDYCWNGDFDNSTDPFLGWDKGSAGTINAETIDGVSCVWIETSSSSAYISWKFYNYTSGQIEVQFRARMESGTGQLRVYCHNAYQTVTVGTDWQDYDLTFTSAPEGDIEVEFYNRTTYSTMYITGVKILAPYWEYNEAMLEVMSDSITAEVTRATSAEDTLKSSIQMTADSITAEVSRATAAEDTLKSSIQMTADNITAEVSRATAAEDTLKSSIQMTADNITAEVSRATAAEGELKSSIQINADNITSCVTKNNIGSYITQYYDNVIVAFNNNSKYVQITAGAISIYDASISDSKKRAVFNEQGNHFYRDGYYVGKIGTNSWTDNSSHKGLVFDLEYTGKYMAFAEAASSSATEYTCVWTYSRASSIYTSAGLHAGCNVYLENYHLDGADMRNSAANGYSVVDNATVPIITAISSNGSGGISWTSSSIRVRNGMITGVPS